LKKIFWWFVKPEIKARAQKKMRLRFRYDVVVEARSAWRPDAQLRLRGLTDAFQHFVSDCNHEDDERHLLQDFCREGCNLADLPLLKRLLERWRWKTSWPPEEWYQAETLRADLTRRTQKLVPTLKRSFASVLRKSNPNGVAGSFSPDTVHDYQWRGAGFAVALRQGGQRGAAIFDAMGLGKTLQALMTISHLAREHGVRRVVIVCPNQEIRHQWGEEFRTWGLAGYFGVDTDEMIKLKDTPRYPARSTLHVLTATPNWLRHEGNIGKLDATTTLLVVDEAHLAKNAYSGSLARTSQIFRALRACTRRRDTFTLLLTGTPMTNACREFYAYMDLMQCLEMDFPEFAFRYCDRKRKYGVPELCWNDDGVSAAEEFRSLQTHCIARPSKDLPETRETRRAALHLETLTPSGEFEGLTLREAFAAYDEREARLRKDMRKRSLTAEQRRRKNDELQTLPMRRWELSAAAKAPAVAEALRDLLENETSSSTPLDPLIVFAFHMCMFDALETVMQDFPDITFASVNGRALDSNAGVDAFKRGDVRVLFVSLSKTAGLNLQNCRRTWFAEIPWSWGDRRQAEKRTNRMGQKAKSVEYVYWLGEAPATCERVYKGTFRKEKNIKRALHVQSSSASSTSSTSSTKRRRTATATL